MTQKEIYKKVNKFQVGDMVTIKESIKSEDGKQSRTKVTTGKILARYPHFLLIGRGESYANKVSFLYSDIAHFGCMEKKKGRPGKRELR